MKIIRENYFKLRWAIYRLNREQRAILFEGVVGLYLLIFGLLAQWSGFVPLIVVHALNSIFAVSASLAIMRDWTTERIKEGGIQFAFVIMAQMFGIGFLNATTMVKPVLLFRVVGGIQLALFFANIAAILWYAFTTEPDEVPESMLRQIEEDRTFEIPDYEMVEVDPENALKRAMNPDREI